MRLFLKMLAAMVAILVVAGLAVVGDVALDGGRLISALLGRDRLIAACSPALVDKLKGAGFQPGEVMFGDSPDIAVSTLTGRSFRDTFTFTDGAAETRVDGIMACILSGTAVTVEFRTSRTPVRAT